MIRKTLESILAHPLFRDDSGKLSSRVSTYTTQAGLRTVDGVSTSKAFVPGVGHYRWTSNTSSPHDGGLVVAKASSRTGAWELDYDGPIRPEWYDVFATDPAAAIQMAIDRSRPVNGAGGNPLGEPVYLSRRSTYAISRPLVVYSGTHLYGGGTIVAADDFIGDALIIGGSATTTATTQLTNFIIENIQFDPGAIEDLWAVDLSNMVNVLNSQIDIVFWTQKGLNLSSYAQHCKIRRLHSFGACDRILWLKGNHNEFERIDKEGPTGDSTDPYILIDPHSFNSQGNHFKHVLIEGDCSENKTAFVANNCVQLTIDDLWMELNASNGYALDLNGCNDFKLKGCQTHITSAHKWRFRNSSIGQVEFLSSNAEGGPWQDMIEVDDTSIVSTPVLYSRYTENARPIASGPRIHAEAHIGGQLTGTPVNGRSPVSRATNAPASNMFRDPNFAAGGYGWSAWGGDYHATLSFPLSEVGSANEKMCQMDTFTSPSNGILQTFTIDATQVGHPIVVTMLAKIEGAGFIYPFVGSADGAGVDDTFFQQLTEDAGWGLISAVVTPSAAGTLYAGLTTREADNTTVVKLARASCVFGDHGYPAGASYRQLDIDGIPIVFGTAAPTTGTWPRGALCINSTPSSGGTPAWTCTAGGSPGTWKAWGSLA